MPKLQRRADSPLATLVSGFADREGAKHDEPVPNSRALVVPEAISRTAPRPSRSASSLQGIAKKFGMNKRDLSDVLAGKWDAEITALLRDYPSITGGWAPKVVEMFMKEKVVKKILQLGLRLEWGPTEIAPLFAHLDIPEPATEAFLDRLHGPVTASDLAVRYLPEMTKDHIPLPRHFGSQVARSIDASLSLPRDDRTSLSLNPRTTMQAIRDQSYLRYIGFQSPHDAAQNRRQTQWLLKSALSNPQCSRDDRKEIFLHQARFGYDLVQVDRTIAQRAIDSAVEALTRQGLSMWTHSDLAFYQQFQRNFDLANGTKLRLDESCSLLRNMLACPALAGEFPAINNQSMEVVLAINDDRSSPVLCTAPNNYERSHPDNAILPMIEALESFLPARAMHLLGGGDLASWDAVSETSLRELKKVLGQAQDQHARHKLSGERLMSLILAAMDADLGDNQGGDPETGWGLTIADPDGTRSRRWNLAVARQFAASNNLPEITVEMVWRTSQARRMLLRFATDGTTAQDVRDVLRFMHQTWKKGASILFGDEFIPHLQSRSIQALITTVALAFHTLHTYPRSMAAAETVDWVKTWNKAKMELNRIRIALQFPISALIDWIDTLALAANGRFDQAAIQADRSFLHLARSAAGINFDLYWTLRPLLPPRMNAVVPHTGIPTWYRQSMTGLEFLRIPAGPAAHGRRAHITLPSFLISEPLRWKHLREHALATHHAMDDLVLLLPNGSIAGTNGMLRVATMQESADRLPEERRTTTSLERFFGALLPIPAELSAVKWHTTRLKDHSSLTNAENDLIQRLRRLSGDMELPADRSGWTTRAKWLLEDHVAWAVHRHQHADVGSPIAKLLYGSLTTQDLLDDLVPADTSNLMNPADFCRNQLQNPDYSYAETTEYQTLLNDWWSIQRELSAHTAKDRGHWEQVLIRPLLHSLSLSAVQTWSVLKTPISTWQAESLIAVFDDEKNEFLRLVDREAPLILSLIRKRDRIRQAFLDGWVRDDARLMWGHPWYPVQWRNQDRHDLALHHGHLDAERPFLSCPVDGWDASDKLHPNGHPIILVIPHTTETSGLGHRPDLCPSDRR